MSVNGPISPKLCYHERDYSFYSFYSLDSLEIWLHHNSTYYRSLSKSLMSSLLFHIVIPKASNISCTPSFDLLTDEFSNRVYYKTRLYIRELMVCGLTRWPLGDVGLNLKCELQTHDKSILVEVMAWYQQATSHYLNQCQPRSVLPYDIMRS